MASLEIRKIPQQIILRSSAQGMTMRQAGGAGEFQNNSKSGEGIRLQGGVFGFRRKPPLRLDFCCFERARWGFAWSKRFCFFCLSKERKKRIIFFLLLFS
jgi:hypothetical protein